MAAEQKPGTRHLIVACSGRKDHCDSLLPAIERYTGVNYAVIRSYVRAGGAVPTIWILSARYGLISSTESIPDYDLKMDKGRARQLKADNEARLELFSHSDSGHVTDLFVCLGADYRASLTNVRECFPGARITYAKGGIGVMLGQLKNWLYEVPPTNTPAPAAPRRMTRMAEEKTPAAATESASTGTVTVVRPTMAGKLAGMSKETAQDMLRDAYVAQEPLSNGKFKSDPVHWNVRMDLPAIVEEKSTVDVGEGKTVEKVTRKATGEPVSTIIGVSWAGKVLSSMERSDFSTDDAVKALYKIGFAIEHDGQAYAPAPSNPNADKEAKKAEKAAAKAAKAAAKNGTTTAVNAPAETAPTSEIPEAAMATAAA